MRALRRNQEKMQEEQGQPGIQIATSTHKTGRILQEQNVVGLPPVRT